MTAAAARFVNVGSPATDGFTRSVFRHALGQASKLTIDSNGLANVREEMLGELATGEVRGSSLDIIADAPGGVQRLANILLSEIFANAVSRQLMSVLQPRFTQCRLLGCNTARNRHFMLELAHNLGMPVIGTTCAIAHPDFDHTSFQEIKIIDDTAVRIVISTEEMLPSGSHRDGSIEASIVSGAIQQKWLSQYKQVNVAISDLGGAVSEDLPTLPVPDDFFASPLASTDVIETAVAAAVVLQTPSGAQISAEVLASGTLLRFASREYGPLYMNVPSDGVLGNQLSLL